MRIFDWISSVNKDNFALFLKDKLSINFFDVQKRFDKDYGTYFAVYSDDFKNGVMFFGNYGVINAKSVGKEVKFVDNFEFLAQNQLFMLKIDKKIAKKY